MRRALLVILCGILLPKATPKSALRVVRGRDATLGEYPFVVRIEDHYQRIDGVTNNNVFGPHCTGAALTPTWTLTAAHCFHKPFVSPKVFNSTMKIIAMIRYGNVHMKPSENNQLSAILKVKHLNIKHYLRDGSLEHSDIALLNTEPITVDSYGKLSAVDYQTLYGQEVTLLGFGMMATSGPDAYKILDKPLQIIDRAMLRSCDEMPLLGLCTVPMCGDVATLLFGDSGGPMLHATGIVGVNRDITDIYVQKTLESLKHVAKTNIVGSTPVSPYTDWIHSVIVGNI